MRSTLMWCGEVEEENKKFMKILVQEVELDSGSSLCQANFASECVHLVATQNVWRLLRGRH